MAENFSRLIEPLLLTPDDIDEILGNETGEKKDAYSKGKVEHLPKLLFDRSLSLPRANYSTTQKKFEVAAEENLLKKDLQETVSTNNSFGLSATTSHLCYRVVLFLGTQSLLF